MPRAGLRSRQVEETPCAEVGDVESDDSEDFKSLRREARSKPLARPHPVTDQPEPARVGNVDDLRMNVDPSYFNYGAQHSRSAPPPVEREETDMVQFLRMHGLGGPLRAYARAFEIQGLCSPEDLVKADDRRLAHVLSRVELDISDELLLNAALSELR